MRVKAVDWFGISRNGYILAIERVDSAGNGRVKIESADPLPSRQHQLSWHVSLMIVRNRINGSDPVAHCRLEDPHDFSRLHVRDFHSKFWLRHCSSGMQAFLLVNMESVGLNKWRKLLMIALRTLPHLTLVMIVWIRNVNDTWKPNNSTQLFYNNWI